MEPEDTECSCCCCTEACRWWTCSDCGETVDGWCESHENCCDLAYKKEPDDLSNWKPKES